MEKETSTEEAPAETKEPVILFFDVETSGFRKKGLDPNDPHQAWTVQVGFIQSTVTRVFQECAVILRPPWADSYIHPGAQKTHGISLHDCHRGGVMEECFMEFFNEIIQTTDMIVCHNYNFDSLFLYDMFTRYQSSGFGNRILAIPHVCTMLSTTNLCCLPGRYGKFKWPKLEELYRFLFGEDFVGAHDALADVRATRRCFYELQKRGMI
jgi:DNA polymerase-3 subunit epsilon